MQWSKQIHKLISTELVRANLPSKKSLTQGHLNQDVTSEINQCHCPSSYI